MTSEHNNYTDEAQRGAGTGEDAAMQRQIIKDTPEPQIPIKQRHEELFLQAEEAENANYKAHEEQVKVANAFNEKMAELNAKTAEEPPPVDSYEDLRKPERIKAQQEFREKLWGQPAAAK